MMLVIATDLLLRRTWNDSN